MKRVCDDKVVGISEIKFQKNQRITDKSLPSKVVLLGADRETRGTFGFPLNRRNCAYWCARDMFGQISYFDAWFELETPENIERLPIGKDYIRWLALSDEPIYMQRHYTSVPNSIEYPLMEMIGEFGAYYLSPLSYMLALAINRNFSEIELCGCRVTSHTKPSIVARDAKSNIEYFLGIAQGRGIRISISPESILLRRPSIRHRNLKEEVRQRLKRLRLRRSRLRQTLGQLTLLNFEARLTGNRPDRILLGLQPLIRADMKFVEGQISECAHLLGDVRLFERTEHKSRWKAADKLYRLFEILRQYLYGRFIKS